MKLVDVPSDFVISTRRHLQCWSRHSSTAPQERENLTMLLQKRHPRLADASTSFSPNFWALQRSSSSASTFEGRAPRLNRKRQTPHLGLPARRLNVLISPGCLGDKISTGSRVVFRRLGMMVNEQVVDLLSVVWCRSSHGSQGGEKAVQMWLGM